MGVTFKQKPSEFDAHLGGKKAPHPSKMVAQQAKGSVMATKKTGDHEQVVVQTDEVLHKGVLAAAEDLCSVTVGGGMTIPTEPYANVKLMVSVTVPCSKAALNDTYEFATDWVGSKLEEAQKKLTEN